MSAVELLASYWTLAGAALPHSDHEYSPFAFQDRVEAAARAGFTGMGFWHADLEHLTRTLSYAQMRGILESHGIRHVEIEFLTGWFLPPGERRSASDRRRAQLFTACEELRARHLKVGDFARSRYPLPQVIDAFGQLCREAATRGIRIVYELIPLAVVGSLAGTRALVEGAAQPNGGVMFDLWHIVKLGIPYEDVMRFPAAYFLALEINDGYLRTPAGMDLVTETTAHRRLPGQGEFDIQGFVDRLPSSPYRGPVGVEVLSAELRTWPLEKAATEAFRTTAALFH